MKLKILKIKEETHHCFSLIIEKPFGFDFYPGQYLDIELDIKANDTKGNIRAFTISSSPTENFLMITPKKGISDFKKALEKLKTGDLIQSSHPAGTFTLDETSPAVFITGGIGVTPFRSILKYAVDQKINTSITLVYSNSSENFLFKEELDSWQTQIKNCTIHYINTSIKGRLDKEKLQILYPYPLPLTPIYYLAGSQSMIYNFSKYLQDLGVDEINIRTDSFDGYE